MIHSNVAKTQHTVAIGKGDTRARYLLTPDKQGIICFIDNDTLQGLDPSVLDKFGSIPDHVKLVAVSVPSVELLDRIISGLQLIREHMTK